MELEQIVMPRLYKPQSSGLLNIESGSKLLLKLVIGAIAIFVLLFILSKLGVFQWQFFEERRVKEE